MTALRLAVLALLSAVLPKVSLVTADERPNIVFIFTDDHAPHAIGAYNGWLSSINPTPNIDHLGSQPGGHPDR